MRLLWLSRWQQKVTRSGKAKPPIRKRMKLSDVATIRTNFQEADFWITRRGSLK
ncbi:hypothetical protein CGU17_004274, partial [Salmonella enterica subsp. enterica serovar Johannesburg]|nr:hypothetical protein [Salmonella enterica subsp. enterica serovar Johannesburg]EDW6951165.1 hypothetical protein [Salmonella enterica subsp. enterica serovar Johannesburg]